MNKELVEKAKKRWKECLPKPGLTWGRVVNGDAFMAIFQKYFDFSDEKNILELGPGYGRILSSIILKNIPFGHYTGLDISPKNIEMLKEKFNFPNVDFVQGDFSETSLNKKYDLVVSSLAIHHQYPTVFNSIKNISKFMNENGILIFDCPENISKEKARRKDLNELLEMGPQKGVWEKGVNTDTFIGYYRKEELSLILDATPLKLISFDKVIHDESSGPRLVTIAEKVKLYG